MDVGVGGLWRSVPIFWVFFVGGVGICVCCFIFLVLVVFFAFSMVGVVWGFFGLPLFVGAWVGFFDLGFLGFLVVFCRGGFWRRGCGALSYGGLMDLFFGSYACYGCVLPVLASGLCCLFVFRWAGRLCVIICCVSPVVVVWVGCSVLFWLGGWCLLRLLQVRGTACLRVVWFLWLCFCFFLFFLFCSVGGDLVVAVSLFLWVAGRVLCNFTFGGPYGCCPLLCGWLARGVCLLVCVREFAGVRWWCLVGGDGLLSISLIF